MDKNTHQAMSAVLEGMGRAAREGRARRFTKRPGKGVEVQVGEIELEPMPGADRPVDPAMSDGDMDELARDLEVQR